MADRALGAVKGCPNPAAGLVLRQAARPRYVVGVHIKNALFRIDGRAAPLPAAVISRKDDCLLPNRERNKLSRAAKIPELLSRPGVRLGGPVREHICSQQLA